MIHLANYAITDSIALLTVPSARWTIPADNPSMILMHEESVKGTIPHYSIIKNTIGAVFSDFYKGILDREP